MLQATHENQLLDSYIQEIELHNPESVTAEAAWILWFPGACKPKKKCVPVKKAGLESN